MSAREEQVWIVTLGDGTWVELDERPTVMLFPRSVVDAMDEAPIDCADTDHIHIRDLVEQSHWNDDAEPQHRAVWEEV